MKNSLLRVATLNTDQERKRLIYQNIGKNEFADNFLKIGDQVSTMLDSIRKNLYIIVEIDSTVSATGIVNQDLLHLANKINNEIVNNTSVYNQAFNEYISAKVTSDTAKMSILDAIIDTAAFSIKSNISVIDSIIDQQSMIRIKEIETRINNVKNLLLLILLGMSVFSVSFALLFSRYISHHLRRLRESANTIATGDFDFNPKGYPQDEIGDLATAFFDMAHDLKKTQDELIRKRRLAAIGEIVASVNHEINNPLMIISGNAQFLEMTIENGVTQDTKERIHAILEETERISQVTRKLRDIKNPVVEDYTSSGEQMINLDKSTV
jgi:signal transduction histidine kinase